VTTTESSRTSLPTISPAVEPPVLILLLVGLVHRLQQAFELRARFTAEVLPELALQQSVYVRHGLRLQVLRAAVVARLR